MPNDEPISSPLTAAAERARESMLILLDYLKVAAEVHKPDQYQPAIDAASHLSEALYSINRIKEGYGRRDTCYVGFVSAE